MNSTKCSHCGREIPNDFEFCPFCGQAIEKKKICPQCSKDLPDGDFRFCPFCGATLREDTSIKEIDSNDLSENTSEYMKGLNSISPQKTSPQKKDKIAKEKKCMPRRGKITISIAAILVLVIAGASFMVIHCYSLADEGLFAEAKTFYIKPFYQLFDPTFVRYMDAGLLYEEGAYTESLKLFNELVPYRESTKMRMMVATARSTQLNEYYNKGISAYTTGDYPTAIDYFTMSEKGDDYIFMCYVHLHPDLNLSLTPVGLGYEDTKELLKTKYSEEYLKGYWETRDSTVFFEVFYAPNHNATDDLTKFNTNLPFKSGESDLWTFYSLKDGIFSVDGSGVAKGPVFSFEVVSFNEMLLYCYADGYTYRLYRK